MPEEASLYKGIFLRNEEHYKRFLGALIRRFEKACRGIQRHRKRRNIWNILSGCFGNSGRNGRSFMATVGQIFDVVEAFAPVKGALSTDNVGLLAEGEARRPMPCS